MTEAPITYQNLFLLFESLGFKRLRVAAVTNRHVFCHAPTDTILAFGRHTGELVTAGRHAIYGGSPARPRHIGRTARVVTQRRRAGQVGRCRVSFGGVSVGPFQCRLASKVEI